MCLSSAVCERKDVVLAAGQIAIADVLIYAPALLLHTPYIGIVN